MALAVRVLVVEAVESDESVLEVVVDDVDEALSLEPVVLESVLDADDEDDGGGGGGPDGPSAKSLARVARSVASVEVEVESVAAVLLVVDDVDESVSLVVLEELSEAERSLISWSNAEPSGSVPDVDDDESVLDVPVVEEVESAALSRLDAVDDELPPTPDAL